MNQLFFVSCFPGPVKWGMPVPQLIFGNIDMRIHDQATQTTQTNRQQKWLKGKLQDAANRRQIGCFAKPLQVWTQIIGEITWHCKLPMCS